MTAPKTGPPGYEQQYRVTVWLALLLNDPSLRVYVEVRGEEDFTLRLDVNGVERVVEVQVKSSEKSLDAESLVEILGTFPPQTSQDCFLERVRSNADSVGVIVVGGRVLDDVDPLVVPHARLTTTARVKPTLDVAQAQRLLTHLAALHANGSTTLWRERHQRCVQLSTEIDARELRQLGRRIFVLERVDAPSTIRAIAMMLELDHRVPGAIAPTIADPLLRQIVEKGRDSGADIMPDIRSCIAKHQADRIQPRAPYVRRGTEENLAERLERERVMLLTGFPWCGKTQLALALAEMVQARGYHVQKFDDAADAERFLLDPASGERRLALLEDPLGRHELSHSAADSWDRLASLVPLAPHRALLVTSRADLLQTLHESADAEDWRLSKHRWIKVATTDTLFARQVWQAWASDKGFAEDVVAHVSDALAAAELEPGHYSRLATEDPQQLLAASLEWLLRTARGDAEEVGRRLCQDASTREVLLVLALTASTLTGPRDLDLAYFLSATEERPGRRLQFESRDAFPSYPTGAGIPPTSRGALDALESRGVIERSSARVVFTHPFWERAAEVALTRGGHYARRDRDTLIDRALLGLDADCAVRCVEVVDRLKGSDQRPGVELDALVSALLVGTESIFPRVAGRALVAVLTDLDALTGDRQEKLIASLAESLPSSNVLRWQDDNAWVAKSGGLNAAMERRKGPTPSMLQTVLQDGLFSPRTVQTVLDHRPSQDQVSLEILERALSSHEPTLRARAGYVLAKHHAPTIESEPLLRRALNDAHPWVVAETIEGLTLAWIGLNPDTQTELRTLLSRILVRPAFGLVVLRKLQSFQQFAGWNEDWYHGLTSPWNLWAACTTTALSTYPARRPFDQVKLYTLSMDAIPRLAQTESVALVEAWLNWAERRVHFSIPDDYGGSIAQALLLATGHDPSARAGVFDRLLNQRDTGLQVMLLCDLSLGWNQLSSSEQGRVLAALRSERPDRRWLQAVVMAAGDPPQPIQAVLVGHPDAMSMTPSEVVNCWPLELLADCVSVYTGHPQPLWWIGTHHRNDAFWCPVIAYLARDEHPSLMRRALREVVRRDNDELYRDCWRDLCSNASHEGANAMFEALLYWTVCNTNAALDYHWEQLMRSPAAPSLRQGWATRTGRWIAGIAYGDNLLKLLHLPEVFADLRAESLMLGVLLTAEREKLSADLVSASLRFTFDEDIIRSAQAMWTLDTLRDIAGKELSQAQRAGLEARRSELIDLGHEQVLAIDDHYTLPDWIEISRAHEHAFEQ